MIPLPPPHNRWENCCVCMGICSNWFFTKHSICECHPCWCCVDNLTYIEMIASKKYKTITHERGRVV